MNVSPAAAREMRRLALDVVLLDGEQDAAPDLSDMARRAKALLDGALRQSKAPPKPRAPGATRETRRERKDTREAEGKAAAFKRSEDPPGKPRCEVGGAGARCLGDGVDPDHVIGGSYKRDCERIGAEGFQIMCRAHHEMKTTNTPTRDYWLIQAEEHAIRTGAKRLLPLIAKARARYAAKHGARVDVVVSGKGRP